MLCWCHRVCRPKVCCWSVTGTLLAVLWAAQGSDGSSGLVSSLTARPLRYRAQFSAVRSAFWRRRRRTEVCWDREIPKWKAMFISECPPFENKKNVLKTYILVKKQTTNYLHIYILICFKYEAGHSVANMSILYITCSNLDEIFVSIWIWKYWFYIIKIAEMCPRRK